jgi:hypothetical protein
LRKTKEIPVEKMTEELGMEDKAYTHDAKYCDEQGGDGLLISPWEEGRIGVPGKRKNGKNDTDNGNLPRPNHSSKHATLELGALKHGVPFRKQEEPLPAIRTLR